MSWYNTKKAAKLLNKLSDIAVYDLETTGKYPESAEILQIFVCDGNGIELFSSYVRPVKHKRWKQAEEINGISPEMVAGAPTFSKIRPKVQEVFNRAKVVAGYNCKRYDNLILERCGIVLPRQCFDVMAEFQLFHPQGRHRLKDCAAFCGVSFSPHDAGEDARATARCLEKLLSSPGFAAEERKKQQHITAAQAMPITGAVEKQKSGKRGPSLKRLWYRLEGHQFKPFLCGLLFMAVGGGWLYYRAGGSFKHPDLSFFRPDSFLCAANADGNSMLLGMLCLLGALLAVYGLCKGIKKTMLRLINGIRKILSGAFRRE